MPPREPWLRSTLLRETILNAVAILDSNEYLLEDVTACDVKEGFAVTYHFCPLKGPNRLALRLLLPHEEPSVPSISGIFAGADWHERECFDFFGIEFRGHPNLHPLLLPEDFEGHPLVKARQARKSLQDVLPDAWIKAAGLEETIAAHAALEAEIQSAAGAREQS